MSVEADAMPVSATHSREPMLHEGVESFGKNDIGVNFSRLTVLAITE